MLLIELHNKVLSDQKNPIENAHCLFNSNKSELKFFLNRKYAIKESNIKDILYGDKIEHFSSKHPEIVISNYKDFINIMDEQKVFSETWIVYNELNNKEIFLFKGLLNVPVYELVGIYKPENDTMYDFTVKLFKIDSSEDFYQIFQKNITNDFKIIANKDLLNVIFAKKHIESVGEEIYTKFNKKSKSGKVREIIAPHPEIKEALKKLNGLLQNTYDSRNEDFQIAYKKNKNVKTGAEIHKDSQYVFNIDIHHFFPSCKKKYVEKYLSFLFVGAYNSELLKKEFYEAILDNDALFIGNPISGTIANAIISKPVFYIKNICNKYGIKFSVYADDMTFSSDKFLVKDYVTSIFNNAFEKYGLNNDFVLNEDKSVGFSGCNRKITGVKINNNNQITVSRVYYRNIRSLIYHLSKGDSVNIQKLRGQIAYATMIDDSGKIYNYLNKFSNTVKQFNLCSDEKLKELEGRCK